MFVAGYVGWILSATGALRWIGRAALWLLVFAVLGVGFTATLLVTGTLLGIWLGILEERAGAAAR